MKHLTLLLLTLTLSACANFSTNTSQAYQYISQENQAAFDAYILLVASRK